MPPNLPPERPGDRATDPRGFRPDKTTRIEIAELERAMRKARAKEAVAAVVVLGILALSFGAALYVITEIYEWMARC